MTRSRIAPTPSGYLHIGNAMNFVTTWLMVRKAGGRLRLRIDDIDAPRAKTEYIEDIFRTLDWIGMDWDEGPQTADEQVKLYSQSLKAERYNDLIQKLITTGKVFACKCSRKEISTPGHVCPCRNEQLDIDTPDTSLRIETSDQPIVINDAGMGRQEIHLNRGMKDFVIRRRDDIVAYQVASLADDIDHQINLIVRGADLLASTAAQLYLASMIGEDSFMRTTFYHHPLISDDNGQKLSKSADSFSLKAMSERDKTAEKLYIDLSKLLGLSRSCTTLQEMRETDHKFTLQ